MGRGRGKGKKHSVIAARDDTRNSGEENLTLKRRVGRPQKSLKDDIENENENECQMVKEEDGGHEDMKSWVSSESSKNQSCMDDGRKRKRASLKEHTDLVKEENDIVTKANATVLVKPSVGYRQIGRRRKSTPRRAAEVGVECK
ncbi:uncharacterized protein LOC142506235 [Primulina tabacum]|uniref:uncharacterized protein LOC142506235 n=1 Tax=Primulina tabacum TaxID=48773 RepID=UPI003F5AD173